MGRLSGELLPWTTWCDFYNLDKPRAKAIIKNWERDRGGSLPQEVGDAVDTIAKLPLLVTRPLARKHDDCQGSELLVLVRTYPRADTAGSRRNLTDLAQRLVEFLQARGSGEGLNLARVLQLIDLVPQDVWGALPPETLPWRGVLLILAIYVADCESLAVLSEMVPPEDGLADLFPPEVQAIATDTIGASIGLPPPALSTMSNLGGAVEGAVRGVLLQLVVRRMESQGCPVPEPARLTIDPSRLLAQGITLPTLPAQGQQVGLPTWLVPVVATATVGGVAVVGGVAALPALAAAGLAGLAGLAWSKSSGGE